MTLNAAQKLFFLDEEDFKQAHSRAEMGDDRAAVRLAKFYGRPVALFSPRSGKGIERHEGLVTEGPNAGDFYGFGPDDKEKSEHFYKIAEEALNFDAISFERAVEHGLRSPTLQYCRDLVPVIGNSGEIYVFNNNGTRTWVAGHIPKNANLAGALDDSEMEEGWEWRRSRFDCPSVHEYSPGHLYIVLHGNPYDRNGKRFVEDKPYGDIISKTTFNRPGYPDMPVRKERLVHALRRSAISSPLGANMLAHAHGTPKLYKRNDSLGAYLATAFFVNMRTEELSNPIYDLAEEAKWKHIESGLRGKLRSTPSLHKKFMDDHLFAHDHSAEGLYDIGMAMRMNAATIDPDTGGSGKYAQRGLDYLRHAANFGYAPAARELGEQWENTFYRRGDESHLQQACFWYDTAAELGHANAKARVAYLKKAFPAIANGKLDASKLRNPSDLHIQRYPASAWAVDVAPVDLSFVMMGAGSIRTRLQEAAKVIDGQTEVFEKLGGLIQAKLDDIKARQLVAEGKIDHLRGEELAALRTNTQIDRDILSLQRQTELSQNRWVKEYSAITGATILVELIMPGGGIAAQAAGTQGGFVERIGEHLANRSIRASGDLAASRNEKFYNDMAIKELADRRIDVSVIKKDVGELAQLIKKLDHTAAVLALKKDKEQRNQLLGSMLLQRIIHSGLQNCELLENYCQAHEVKDVESFLHAFEANAPLHDALHHMVLGHADTRDMKIILAESNALRGKASLIPEEQVLRDFVESCLKRNIDSFFSRASQIDVIQQLGVIDFDRFAVLKNLSAPAGREEASGFDVRSKLDLDTRTLITGMFAREFGFSHIGNYDVRRLFSFYLHRHGDKQLFAGELRDGQVLDENDRKAVSARHPNDMEDFNAMVKESYKRGRKDQPSIGNLLLRVCGYEYFLPQAVRTVGENNRFADNPEAPASYEMANTVIHCFVKSLAGIELGKGSNIKEELEHYRSTVGDVLDAVIAQSFIDYFQYLGKEHAASFAQLRERLQSSFQHDSYGPRYDAYVSAITKDAIRPDRFKDFLKIYARNLEAQMEIARDSELDILERQLKDARDKALNALVPETLVKPGSVEALARAREGHHRYAHMTDG
jgi:TPR repeat protein